MADRRVKVVVEAEIGNYRKGMQDASKATDGLAKSTDKLSPSTDKAAGGVSKLSAAVRTHGGDMQTVGTGFAAAGAGLTAIAVGAGKAAMDWESAWAGVMKTNDGTSAQTQKLEDDLRNLTSVLPSTHTEIAAVAEAAGQLGVGIDDAAGFSKVMLDLGETTNLSADEAATALARFSNIMGTSFDDADRLGSTIVGLGNNFATTEAEIVNMSMRVAAVGRQMGMSESDVLAMSTAMSSVGVEAEAGGTAIANVMKKIDSSVREGGDSLTGWAEAAGVSAEEFAAAWQADPAQAMVMLTEHLGEVSAAGGDVNGILSDLGVKGIRESDTILRLASANGVLASALEEGATAWEQNIALAEEASVRYETTESKIAIAWNQIKDAAIDAGGALLPIVATVAEGAAGIASAFAALPDPVKNSLGVLSGVGGIALLAAGGFLTLAPRVVETVDAMRNLGLTGPKARGALKGLGIASGAAIAIGALVTAAVNIHNAGQPAAVTLEEVANQLSKVQKSGEASDWDELFDFGTAGVSLNNFSDALSLLDPSTPAEHLNSFGQSVMGVDNNTAKAIAAIEKMDQLFATLDPAEAAEQMNKLRIEQEQLGNTDLSHWSSLKELFPEYAAGIEEAASATGVHATSTDLMLISMGQVPQKFKDAAASAEEAGEAGEAGADGIMAFDESTQDAAAAAEELADALKDALDGLREMGVIPRNAQAANDAYEASLDSLTASIKENGATLDDNTEKGRNNRQALRDHTDAGLENAAAMAEVGASSSEISGALMGTYNSLVENADAMGLSTAEAESYARQLLDIPDDVNVETWMSDEAARIAELTGATITEIPDGINVLAEMSTGAQEQAFKTAAAIEVIPGYKRVDVAVDDQGTPGQIQSRINALTGTTEHIFVTDDGTVSVTQQKITGIDGKTEYVYVTDDGTVVATQGSINNVKGKDVQIGVTANTSAAEAAINLAARARSAVINVTRRVMGQAALAEGGIAGLGGLPRYSNGGRLPSYGKGTDTILGIGSNGTPTAWVDDGEMVVRRSSTQKYMGVLDRINRNDPSVRHLAGYAGGGSVGREWSASSMGAPAMASGPVPASVDSGVIANAVASAISSYQPVVKIGMREFIGEMKQDRAWKGAS